MQLGGQCITVLPSPAPLRHALQTPFMEASAILTVPGSAGMAMSLPVIIIILADMTLA